MWLNEGIAVSSESRLCLGHLDEPPHESHSQLVDYWDVDRIQLFWSGESFQLADEGSKLSYDLAQILVGQLSHDWPSFLQFVNNADHQDGGAAAAEVVLDLDLGEVVCIILEKEPDPGWSPALEKDASTVRE